MIPTTWGRGKALPGLCQALRHPQLLRDRQPVLPSRSNPAPPPPLLLFLLPPPPPPPIRRAPEAEGWWGRQALRPSLPTSKPCYRGRQALRPSLPTGRSTRHWPPFWSRQPFQRTEERKASVTVKHPGATKQRGTDGTQLTSTQFQSSPIKARMRPSLEGPCTAPMRGCGAHLNRPNS